MIDFSYLIEGLSLLKNPASVTKIDKLDKNKTKWTALDILYEKNIDPRDKLDIIFYKHLLHNYIFNEFACRCAERAVYSTKEPNRSFLYAIACKRNWMEGKIKDADLVKLSESVDETETIGSIIKRCWTAKPTKEQQKEALWK